MIRSLILSKLSLKYLLRYIKEYYVFKSKLSKRNSQIILKKFPIFADYKDTHEIDYHYTYHPAWALRKVLKISPKSHVDLASKLDFSLALSAFIPVVYHDFREVNLRMSNFNTVSSNLMSLPLESNSIESLSCMHVIEHIGLGRYGDPINLDGDILAINEILRVLAFGGYFIFVVPVCSINRIEFNAHRVYSYKYIIETFKSLKLIEFSLIKDDGEFIENCNPIVVDTQNYGCGCFLFKKESL